MTALHLVVRPMLAEAYDLAPLAVRLGEWERQGFAIAQYGKYHGQFHFAGRLAKPISVVGLTDDDMPDWLARFPAGKVVSYYGVYPEGARPEYVQPFRRGYVIVWDRSVALSDPGVLSRDGVSKNAP
ncbi:MAG: hypothetical protein RX316_10760 [bacterium]|nr:hypothetical protein [bacterium]